MYSLTQPALDSMYISYGKGSSLSIGKFVPTCQLNCPYLTTNLYHDPIRNRAHIVLKSRSGMVTKTFTGSVAHLVEYPTWNLILEVVRNYVPSSCDWAGDLEASLRREVRDLPWMANLAPPSRRLTQTLEGPSQTGISTDTESPRFLDGSSWSEQTGESQREPLLLEHQPTDSHTSE